MHAADKYIRFDWAIKRILRDKANFDVLEGFISVFTGENVKIDCLLESEGNQDAYDDKFNRVDIKARNENGEIIIIEVQLSREVHYLERVVYGAAKSITEQLDLGQSYYNLKKVISISVVYFDLGKGSDYLYHGQVKLEGVHSHDILTVTRKEEKALDLPREGMLPPRRMHDPSEVFPEYYLIRVNEFNQYAKTPIEEWMDYLKNGIIDDDTKAPGLSEAKQKLQYLMMTDDDRVAYERHMDAVRIQNDVLDNAKNEGRAEGLAEGRAEGRAEGLAEGIQKGMADGIQKGMVEGLLKGAEQERLNMARGLKQCGVPLETIMQVSGLSADEIGEL